MNTSARHPLNESKDRVDKALQEFLVNGDELQSLRGLKTALRGLPQAEPPAETGWEQVLSQLNADSTNDIAASNQRKVSHGWLRTDEWLGIAAALLVVIAVMFYRPPLSISPPATQTIAQQDSQLQQLVARSQQLETVLRALRQQDNGQVLSGRQAVATDELERMIGFVDLQIAASEVNRNPLDDSEGVSDERTGLWQQRVVLLHELLVNQYAARYNDFMAGSAVDATAVNTLNQNI